MLVAAGEFIPADGEIIEGVASVDESAITGESAPVIREAGGDRSAVTGGTRVLSDWIKVRVTSDPGQSVPRSHDRAGRRRRAAEDAERDRAEHPAGGPDDHLPAGGRHAAALRHLLGRAAVALRAGLAAGLPDPDDDRRAAVGDRHRRHGPPGPAQRAGDVGPRGRGGRRRGHAAARQDRHDHLRQSAGDRVPAAAGRRPRRSWPTRRSSPRSPTRRRRAARSSCWRRRSTASAAATLADTRRRSCRSPRRRACRASTWTAARSAKAPPTAIETYVAEQRRRRRAELRGIVDRIARSGGTPLVVAERRARARRHPSQGHRQGRHPRALRRAARDGHQDGDDHRRQPADRGVDRARGRRRRLPRPGDAGRQDGADQARAEPRASWSR